MAYSGLGAGTQADPYQITTVAQLMETNNAAYAGVYFLLMNDLDLASNASFTISNFYCKLDGVNKSLLNIPCSGIGFYFHDIYVKANIFVHGTCIVNGYLYGTTRNAMSGSPTVNGCLVKAPVDNVSNYVLIPIYLSDTLAKSYDMDSIVAIGTKLFFISKYASSTDRMVVYDTLTDDYQVYKLGSTSAYGAPGAPGKSAYELAVEAGFPGTISEWLVSLKGEPGIETNASVRSISVLSQDEYDAIDIKDEYTLYFIKTA